MANTYARTQRTSWVQGGGKRAVATDVTLVDNYVTGGWAITPGNLGFDKNATLDVVDVPNVNGYDLQYDYTNKKIKAYSAAGTELANASAALNGVVVRVYVIGN